MVLGHAELRAVCVGLVAVVVLSGIAVTHEPLVEHLLLRGGSDKTPELDAGARLSRGGNAAEDEVLQFGESLKVEGDFAHPACACVRLTLI